MDFNQKIPDYLIEKRNIVRLILLTAAFALVFINIYAPFGVKTWFNENISQVQLLFYSSLIILTGVLVVVVSRIIMYQICRRIKKITIGQYLLWIGAEVTSMSIFYTSYERIFLNDQRPFMDTLKVSVENTALVLLLPYSMLWLYFSWIDRSKQLKELWGNEITSDLKEMIPFRDEKGIMRISVKTSDLLYLQAADNYVTIFYTTQQKQAKYMLRSSLKLIETDLKGSPLIRCHRSYMVNFEKVKIIRRESDGLRLELDAPTLLEIPVSKTYMNEVFKAFGHNLI
jgi:DNA-binding LytR/AlgR family response regulator